MLFGFDRRLTRVFALALYLPEGAFDEIIKVAEAAMTVLHYPSRDASRDDQNGSSAHTDVEFWAIIKRDTGGLEVLSKSGGWIKALPVAVTFVVNVSGCFMRDRPTISS